MKLYNPIVGGTRIMEEVFSIDIDEQKEVEDKDGKELMKKYPFLANMDAEEQQPDGIGNVREIELQNSQYSYRDSSRLIDSIKEQAVETRKTIKASRVDELCEKLDKLVNISKSIAKKEHFVIMELKKSNRNIFQKIRDKFKK